MHVQNMLHQPEGSLQNTGLLATNQGIAYVNWMIHLTAHASLQEQPSVVASCQISGAGLV